MRGSVSVCLYKGRQIEKTFINFFEESGLNATLKSLKQKEDTLDVNFNYPFFESFPTLAGPVDAVLNFTVLFLI